MSATDRRQELVEIRALTSELRESGHEVLARVRDAQDELGIRDRYGVGQHDDGPLVAFVHIPKTAGGTVKGMFANAYSGAAIRNAGNYGKGSERSGRKIAKRGDWEQWRRRGGRMVIGHVPYGLMRKHLPADTRYITFLREPVDRVLSHYYRHIDRTGSVADRPGAIAADSLEEALIEQRLPDISNLATRLLSGDSVPLADLPADALEKAKATLRGFTFVGIQERFWESVVLLRRNLRLDLELAVDRHVSIDRPVADEIPDRERQMIADRNRLDVELYAFGRSLFDEAIAAVHDEAFKAEVETLRGLSAAKNEAELQKATDWLERELPAGARRPQDAVRSTAAAAGIESAALGHASGLLSVAKERNAHGECIWTRSETPG